MCESVYLGGCEASSSGPSPWQELKLLALKQVGLIGAKIIDVVPAPHPGIDASILNSYSAADPLVAVARVGHALSSGLCELHQASL